MIRALVVNPPRDPLWFATEWSGSGMVVPFPEECLHPSQIPAEVVKWREEAKREAVTLVTFSPLVLNELSADEITIVANDSEGQPREFRLSDAPGYAFTGSVYLPGEFWLSYTDGDREIPLLTGTPRK